MKLLFLSACFLALSTICTPAQNLSPIEPVPLEAIETGAQDQPLARSSSVRSAEQQVQKLAQVAHMVAATVNGIELTLVICEADLVALELHDQVDGPGSRWQDSRDVAADYPDSLAIINGGFFDPEGKAIGLRRDDGETISRRVPPGSLYHGVIGDDGTQIRIDTLAEWEARPSRDLEAIQTGPRLVWDGEPVEGLSDQRPAWRSFVAQGKGIFIVGRASFSTLAELAKALAELKEVDIDRALNLDGGRSCDLWIQAAVVGGDSVHQRAPFANPVRDFLALRPR